MSGVSAHTLTVAPDVLTVRDDLVTTEILAIDFENQLPNGFTGGALVNTALNYAYRGTTDGATVQRVFTGLTAGASYVLTFTAKASTSTGTGTLTVRASDAGPEQRFSYGIANVANPPTLITFPFIPMTTIAIITFEATSAAPYYLLDAFTLEETKTVQTPVPFTIDPIEAQIEMSESWAPYIRASVTAPLPSADILSRMDPRNRVRATLTLQESYGVGAPVSQESALRAGYTAGQMSALFAGEAVDAYSSQLFTNYDGSNTVQSPKTLTMSLTLVERTTNYAAATVTYQFHSDEALLQGYALLTDTPALPGGALVSDTVRFALRKIGAYLGTPEADAAVLDYDSLVWVPGQTAWEYVSPILQAHNLRLWCDEDGLWHLGPELANGTTPILLTGTSDIFDADDSVSRIDEAETEWESWYDSVHITYRWTDASGVEYTRYDFAPDGPMTEHSRTLRIVYEDTRYPGPYAAIYILQRAQGRGRQVRVTTLNDYRTRPGAPVTIDLPAILPPGHLQPVAGSPGLYYPNPSMVPTEDGNFSSGDLVPYGDNYQISVLDGTLTGYVSSVLWTFPEDEQQINTRQITEGAA